MTFRELQPDPSGRWTSPPGAIGASRDVKVEVQQYSSSILLLIHHENKEAPHILLVIIIEQVNHPHIDAFVQAATSGQLRTPFMSIAQPDMRSFRHEELLASNWTTPSKVNVEDTMQQLFELRTSYFWNVQHLAHILYMSRAYMTLLQP